MICYIKIELLKQSYFSPCDCSTRSRTKKERTEPIDNAATFFFSSQTYMSALRAAARQLQRRPDNTADTQTALNHGTRSLQRLSQLYVQRLSVEEISTVNTLAHYNQNRSRLQLAHVPERMLQTIPQRLVYVYSKAAIKVAPPPKTHMKKQNKTDELKCQRQLFISNERHRAPLTN